MRDYKTDFIALLDEMYNDGCAGMIPCMIAEGIRECEEWSKGDGFLDYHIVNEVYAFPQKSKNIFD